MRRAPSSLALLVALGLLLALTGCGTDDDPPGDGPVTTPDGFSRLDDAGIAQIKETGKARLDLRDHALTRSDLGLGADSLGPVVGSAGGPDKTQWLVDDLGFDRAIDYKAEPIGKALKAAAPDGIDVYFDNVGGEHLEAAVGSLRLGGRIAVCGMISVYNDTEPAPGPRNLARLIQTRGTIQGFLVGDHYDLAGE